MTLSHLVLVFIWRHDREIVVSRRVVCHLTSSAGALIGARCVLITEDDCMVPSYLARKKRRYSPLLLPEGQLCE